MRVWLFVVLSVLLFFPVLADAQCTPPESGDWVVNETIICSSETIILNGSLLINESGNLTLDNSELRFNSSFDGEFGVENNGTLRILSSTLRSETDHAYTFVSNPGAKLEIHGSHIRDCGYYDSHITKQGAYINSDGSVITDSNISDNLNGLLLVGSGLIVDNNTVTHNQLAGLFISGDDNNITNNSVSHNGFGGISIINSKNLRIEGNVILENGLPGFGGYGIELTLTEDVSLINNLVNNSIDYDIYMFSALHTTFANTNYTTLWKGWYLNVTVLDTEGNPVDNAEVVITNNLSEVVLSDVTESEGKIVTFQTEELKNVTGIFRFNPYTVNVTKSNHSSVITINLTENMDVEVILETNLSANVSALLLTIVSPENNSVYFGSDLVNASLLLLEVETSTNVSSCSYMLDSTVVASLSEVTPKNFRSYINVSDFIEGEYIITFLCESETLENTSKVIFSVYPERECLSDIDCEDDENCTNFECVKLLCECGYPSGHECVYYECCENNDCEDDEFCDLETHECEEVQCDCGVPEDHTCVFPYPDYCCEDSHCDVNQTCDVLNHKCVTQILYVYVPERIVQGETIKVYVRDQNNRSVSGASITITYPSSGHMYFFSSDVNGTAEIPVNESGNLQISARKPNYFTGSASVRVAAAFDWLFFFAVFIVIFLAILLPILYKKRVFLGLGLGGPLRLEKTTSGRSVMLRIKNRTKDTLKLLTVVDHVPKGAFIGCSVMPEIEPVDAETDRLKWVILQLNPGEEIRIEYEAAGFYKGFSVEFAGKRYEG